MEMDSYQQADVMYADLQGGSDIWLSSLPLKGCLFDLKSLNYGQ